MAIGQWRQIDENGSDSTECLNRYEHLDGNCVWKFNFSWSYLWWICFSWNTMFFSCVYGVHLQWIFFDTMSTRRRLQIQNRLVPTIHKYWHCKTLACSVRVHSTQMERFVCFEEIQWAEPHFRVCLVKNRFEHEFLVFFFRLVRSRLWHKNTNFQMNQIDVNDLQFTVAFSKWEFMRDNLIGIHGIVSIEAIICSIVLCVAFTDV